MAIFHYFKAFTYIKVGNHYIPTDKEHIFTQTCNCTLLVDGPILVTSTHKIKSASLIKMLRFIAIKSNSNTAILIHQYN